MIPRLGHFLEDDHALVSKLQAFVPAHFLEVCEALLELILIHVCASLQSIIVLI